MTIAVVGAGAGGVELTAGDAVPLARRTSCALGRDPDELRSTCFPPPAHPAHAQRRGARGFERCSRARACVHLDAEVVASTPAACRARGRASAGGRRDRLGHPGRRRAWLRDTGLALDDDGFIRVGDTLQSESDPLVFAAGDCASMPARPLEKAGVFAVRMGMPLAATCAARAGQPLRRYRPQRRWLALISTGDRHAVASRGASTRAATGSGAGRTGSTAASCASSPGFPADAGAAPSGETKYR
jgi:selenide,water dikinase